MHASPIPFTSENVAYLLIEFLNLFVKNTRDSKGYLCVFRLDLKKFYRKSIATSSEANGIAER